MCAFIETRRQEVVGEPGVISLCACGHVCEVDLWVIDRRECAALAVSITGGLMRRDATRQNGGEAGDTYIHPQATMREGKTPHRQPRG